MSDYLDYPEQDQQGPGDSLPTYDDLAVSSGPNSRFGRWRGWIEKRAAERYNDDPEARARRRARGWGDGVLDDADGDTDIDVDETTSLDEYLGRVTLTEPSSERPPIGPRPPSYPAGPIFPPLKGDTLEPCHLRVISFGSRFLPHVTSPVRTLLPVMSDHVLFIGHDEGLSVLDMFPIEIVDNSRSTKGPDEAQARLLWTGEGVHQLAMLEMEHTGRGTPSGVVLALVGSEVDSPSSKEQEWVGTLRMYNLASLISLTKWSLEQKGAPLELQRPAQGNPQQLSQPKKHKRHSSVAKGLISLIGDSHNSHLDPTSTSPSYQHILSPTPSLLDDGRSSISSKGVKHRPSVDSAWDVIDDLPLRWATDYIPLASSGSRLVNTSVLFFELWRDPSSGNRGAALLAIATKQNILLYETPKGQRAFRFIKELYIPSKPWSVTFVQQAVQDNFARRPSDAGPKSSPRHADPRHHGSLRSPAPPRERRGSETSQLQYDAHLSLFVIFEKKAVIIRLADSAVSEVELYDDDGLGLDTLHPQQFVASARKSKPAKEPGFTKESGRKPWVPPFRIDVPPIPPDLLPQSLYVLTRGKQTHIVRAPLPALISAVPPLKVVTWDSQPTSVSPRLCEPSPSSADNTSPFLQLVALSENGVEVQEFPLLFLSWSKGKGKARAEEPLAAHMRAQADVGGDAGFLCGGGQWHRLPQLGRASSIMSNTSETSWDDPNADTVTAPRSSEQGIYGWTRKGLEDWRVFWLGALDL